MKTILLFLLLLLPCISITAQARLGYSPEHLRKEYSDSKYELSFFTVRDTDISYATVNLKTTLVYHFFKDRKKIHLSIIEPKHDKVLHSLIAYYNDNYVNISTTNWKANVENGTINIKLEDFKGSKFFVCELAKEN